MEWAEESVESREQPALSQCGCEGENSSRSAAGRGDEAKKLFFFFSFLNSTDFSAFTKIQLTLRERRQEGRDPKPRWRAWPWEEGHLCVAESEDLRKDRF